MPQGRIVANRSMVIGDLITSDRIVLGLRVPNKAQLLQELARRAAAALGMDVQPIRAALETREHLGSTGLGQGFALPHARIEGLPAFFALCVRLAKPIEFDAIDDRLVDLVVLLLIPVGVEDEHVAALAAIARPLRNLQFLQSLRQAKDAAGLHELIAKG
jgi:nitrogen PTS system EIIA component